MTTLTERFTTSFDALAAIGGSRDAGYRRLTWTHDDRVARRWFIDEGRRIGMTVESDRNGNLWAWWGSERNGAIATGSHLDTVVDGGAFDGALGVVAAFAAVGELLEAGKTPVRPLAVVAFIEEEGARFGLPTMGSRLMTGSLDPAIVRDLRDAGGVTFAAAMAEFGLDPTTLGHDPGLVDGLDAFIELHIEQGVGLADVDEPVGVLSGVWPHGRWRIDMQGTPNHAGTTKMADRRDPMMAVGSVVKAVHSIGLQHEARTTVGRIRVDPNTTNTIAARVSLWVDVRAEEPATIEAVVKAIDAAAREAADHAGVGTALIAESYSEGVGFDAGLSATLERALAASGVRSTTLATAAGHDAAILAPHIPAAMLHVRNPTGVSHSPQETAEVEDCVAGVRVLAKALEELACR